MPLVRSDGQATKIAKQLPSATGSLSRPSPGSLTCRTHLNAVSRALTDFSQFVSAVKARTQAGQPYFGVFGLRIVAVCGASLVSQKPSASGCVAVYKSSKA